MKILILTHEYPPIGGGGANACFFLTKQFAKMDHQVTIITAKFLNEKEEEAVNENIKIYRVKCRRKSKDTSSLFEMFSYLSAAYKKANKILLEKHFDICTVFFGIPSGPIALALKKKYKLPYIIRFGGRDIPGTDKNFKYIYKVLSPIIHRIWGEAEELIANSEGLKDKALLFENRYKISVIQNGVDEQFFVPSENEETDIVQILFVSRLIERKGLQYIIPELKKIRSDVRSKCGKEIELIVVGDGPYKENLQEMVKKTGNADIVKFEGGKNKEQLKKYYQRADIFILPSLFEGMPNVVLEAMASGLPILMTPCEGSKELIKKNGIVSNFDNFPDCLIELCVNTQMRLQMGKISREIVEKDFRWESVAKRYVQLIEKVKR